MQGSVGTAPSTTTLTLADGTTIALADWIDDKLYGSGEFRNASTAQIEIFSVGRAAQIPGGRRNQTRVDTNVPRSGDTGLPKDFEMLVYGYAIKIVRVMRPPTGQTDPVFADGAGAFSDPATLRTLFNLDRVLFFTFEFNGKVYTSGTIQHYPQGHGYTVFSTNSSVELAQNGVPSPRDRVALVLPVHMRENLGFRGIFQPEAALVIAQAATDLGANLTAADIRLDLNGLIKRTVV
jgi:hypothetical protein